MINVQTLHIKVLCGAFSHLRYRFCEPTLAYTKVFYSACPRTFDQASHLQNRRRDTKIRRCAIPQPTHPFRHAQYICRHDFTLVTHLQRSEPSRTIQLCKSNQTHVHVIKPLQLQCTITKIAKSFPIVRTNSKHTRASWDSVQLYQQV